MHAARGALTLLLLLGVAAAGCSDKASGDTVSDAPTLVGEDGQECTSAGRGVVVDEAIRPLGGVTLQVQGHGEPFTSGDDGTYVLPCLADGAYVLLASHPLYSAAQGGFEVRDGRATGPVKLLLSRVVFGEPYNVTQAFDGFIVCSVGFAVYASEECGEGAGVPCEVPVLGCQRVGGQDNNRAQWDFWLDGPFVRELVVDVTWESSSPTLRSFYLVLSTEWTCDPFCIGNELNITTGGAPLRTTASFVNGTAEANTGTIEVTADTRFSTFLWPDWGHGDPTRADVAYNQKYQAFATAFYYLPGPPGYSFLDTVQ